MMDVVGSSAVGQLEAAGEILTPAVRRVLLALEARVGELEACNQALELRVRELEARLSINSTNSSQPPSADPPGTVRPTKPESGRRRGGQPGHRGHHRTVLPPERVDAIVEHRPDACRSCGHALAGAAGAVVVGEPTRHQVIELPPVRALVTEHRAYTLACPGCGTHTHARLPAVVRRHHFGPRLAAFAVTLMSRFRLSRRNLRALLADLLDVPAPAVGTTQAFAEETSAALQAPYQDVRSAVRASPRVWVDETSWALRGSMRWLWTATTPTATLFRLGRRRGTRARELLLGRHYPGIITTDRWRAYDTHPLERRQICWAHLKRNFQGLADSGAVGSDSARLGAWGVREANRLFHAWHQYQHQYEHQYQRGELTHAALDAALDAALKPVRRGMRRLLGRMSASDEKRPPALARDLTRLWEGLWTFLRHEGVEPTNNRAERALRHPVIWRKTSFGSASGAGLRAVERLLTVTETCRQQQRNVFDYLTSAIDAHRTGAPAPQILPAH